MSSKFKHRQIAEGYGPKRSSARQQMNQETRTATFRDRRDRRPKDARRLRAMMNGNGDWD